MGIEVALDLIFLVDLIFNFFTAYFDNEENLIDNQRKIAYNYVKTWLFIDLFSITPVSFFMKNSVNDLFKITRMARINRIIKTFKLVRMMKDVKSKQQKANRDYHGSQQNSTFRLLFFIMMFLILCHNLACLWFMIAKLQDFNEDTWVVRFGYDGLPIFTQYVACFYFIITTITTVGYGDFNAKTEFEMIFCCVLMIIGVIAYSISISSFTSIIAAQDKKRAQFKNKLNVLDIIRKQYGMRFEFYWRLRQSLHYDLSQDMTDKQVFLAQLPNKLKVELSTLMFREELADIKFFSDKSPHFIATIAPLLRPMNFAKGEYVYMNGDPIDAIYFIKRGETAYVDPKPSGDLMFAVNKQGSFFGDVDFTLSTEDGEANRFFSVKAKTDVELLVIQKHDLYQIDLQFKKEMTNLFSRSTSQFERLRGYFDKAKEWYEVTNDKCENSEIQEQSEKAEQSSDDEDADTPKINMESSTSTQFPNKKDTPYSKQLTLKSVKRSKKTKKNMTLNKSQLESRTQKQLHFKDMAKSGSFTSLNESGTFGDYVKSFGGKDKNKSKSPTPGIKRPSRFGKEFIPQTYIDARGISDSRLNTEERIHSSLSPHQHSPKLQMKTMKDIGLFESSSPTLPPSLKEKIYQMENHQKVMAQEFNEMKKFMKAFFRRLQRKMQSRTEQPLDTNNNRDKKEPRGLKRSTTNIGGSRSYSRKNLKESQNRRKESTKRKEEKKGEYRSSMFLNYRDERTDEKGTNEEDEEQEYEDQRDFLFKILKQEKRNSGSDRSSQR